MYAMTANYHNHPELIDNITEVKHLVTEGNDTAEKGFKIINGRIRRLEIASAVNKERHRQADIKAGVAKPRDSKLVATMVTIVTSLIAIITLLAQALLK